MNVQTIQKDGQPEYVILPWDDYQTLLAALEDRIDAAALDDFVQRLAAGEETVPDAVVSRLLAGENCVKVWREHRGLTQAALAQAAGVTQSMVAMIEGDDRRGTVDTLSALALALGVDLEDLLVNEGARSK